jgi:hypothetical protein
VRYSRSVRSRFRLGFKPRSSAGVLVREACRQVPGMTYRLRWSLLPQISTDLHQTSESITSILTLSDLLITLNEITYVSLLLYSARNVVTNNNPRTHQFRVSYTCRTTKSWKRFRTFAVLYILHVRIELLRHTSVEARFK